MIYDYIYMYVYTITTIYMYYYFSMLLLILTIIIHELLLIMHVPTIYTCTHIHLCSFLTLIIRVGTLE